MDKRWVYYQPNDKNPKGDYSDCVIRAFTKVTGKSWLEIFDELIPIARKLQCMPNDKACFEAYLSNKGFVYHGISNKKGTKRPTIESFTKEHPEGVYVLRVAQHAVASVNGHYYDSFDSGDYSMYGYWTK